MSQFNFLVGIFFTGLFAGGLGCLAVQGGLLTATLAQSEEERLKKNLKSSGNMLPILFFLVAKLISYSILGLLLGLAGSVFSFSLTAKVILQLFAVIFMLGTALNLLDVHPIFRYFIIQPPKFLTRLLKNQVKSGDYFAPALLGALTVFIPCGTTQAMMALAMASGSPLSGGLILFSFVLGTSPLFFVFGYITEKLGDAMREKFLKPAAIIIILLALFNLNNTLALAGFNFSWEGVGRSLNCFVNVCFDNSNIPTVSKNSQTKGTTTQELTINFEANRYNPQVLNVNSGSHVKLHLNNVAGSGCIQAFVIPKVGIQKVVPVGTSETVEFDAPLSTGDLSFMCGMGMYRGVIKVI